MSNYTRLRPIQAEGARIGILTCRRCGAALVIDGADDITPTTLHDQWHSEQETP